MQMPGPLSNKAGLSCEYEEESEDNLELGYLGKREIY